MLTEDSRISWLSVKTLTICRAGMCWIHQTLSACCYLSCLEVLETNGPKVLTIRIRGNREPEMAGFIQFVDGETLIMTDQVFSKEAVEQYVEKKLSYKKGKI